jgi:hypothetical protein
MDRVVLRFLLLELRLMRGERGVNLSPRLRGRGASDRAPAAVANRVQPLPQSLQLSDYSAQDLSALPD